MIYTITCNPAIDNILKSDGFAVGVVNRASESHVFAGGKGANVSIILTELGVENIATGFLAGWIQTGSYQQALRMGSIAGSSTAFSFGLASKETLNNMIAEYIL